MSDSENSGYNFPDTDDELIECKSCTKKLAKKLFKRDEDIYGKSCKSCLEKSRMRVDKQRDMHIKKKTRTILEMRDSKRDIFYEFPEFLNLGNYKISKNGDIIGKLRLKILTRALDFSGYEKVQLGRKGYFVHRLLASTFIPNPENKPTVDHIDRDKTNNSLDNLRWANMSEQTSNQNTKKTDNYNRSVNQLDDNGNIIKTFSSITEASLFFGNSKTSGIGSSARNGKTKCFGYKWEFVPITNKEGEMWKEIENHKCYYVSNLGRFKSTLRKEERLLYPTEKGGYLNIVIEGEGHKAHIWVCQTFNGVKPADNYVVNHINGIKTDNRSINLEWMTQKENNQHARSTGLINKMKIGEKVRKPVYQYSLKGIFINKYGSAKEAAASLNKGEDKGCNITSSIRSENSIWGFIFSYDSPEERGILPYNKERIKKVYQYDLEGNFLSEFASAKEASLELGKLNGSSISSNCNGRSKTSYGFYWSYDFYPNGIKYREDNYSDSSSEKDAQQIRLDKTVGSLSEKKKKVIIKIRDVSSD